MNASPDHTSLDHTSLDKASPDNGASGAPSPPAVSWHWRSALAGALISAILLGGGMLIRQRPDPPPMAIHPPPTPAATSPPATPTPAALVVFVSGAVQSPGVYTLTEGARVADLLAAASGFAADANPDAVNQAAPLYDGDQVHVPTFDEAPTGPSPGISGSPDAGADALQPGELVNINTAGLSQLERLPGIGPSLAQGIVDNRPYATVDELERVSGIGPATLAELRSLVTVQ